MANDVVCVGWYGTTLEAELAKGRLKSHGIPSSVTGETDATVQWLVNTVDHKIRLEVPTAFADRARSILEAPAPCPSCGSPAVVERKERPPRRPGWRAWLQFLEASITRRRCTACGHEETVSADADAED